MSEPLRPFTLGEILDRTAQLYRRSFLLFAGVSAVPAAVLIGVLIPMIAGVAFLGEAAAKGGAPQNPALFILIAVFVLVAIPVAMAAAVVSQAALVRAAIDAHMERKMRIRDAIKSVWPRFWRYLGVMFLQGIFAGLIPGAIAGAAIGLVFLLARLAAGGGLATGAAIGFFTFVIAAAAFVVIVIRALGYSLALPACIAEDKSAWSSIKRSAKLSKGTRGRIFLMFLLVYALSIIVSILGYIPMVVITAVAAAMGEGVRVMSIVLVATEIVNVLVNFALQTLITPVYMTALVLFYYDQRIRTEGYDIEWMMERAGLTGAERAPGLATAASDPSPDTGTGNG
ncbi:MAG: hypothetical protein WBE72_05795 [Terracidiphilus sp.]